MRVKIGDNGRAYAMGLEFSGQPGDVYHVFREREGYSYSEYKLEPIEMSAMSASVPAVPSPTVPLRGMPEDLLMKRVRKESDDA